MKSYPQIGPVAKQMKYPCCSFFNCHFDGSEVNSLRAIGINKDIFVITKTFDGIEATCYIETCPKYLKMFGGNFEL